jgi:hypothetical protein
MNTNKAERTQAGIASAAEAGSSHSAQCPHSSFVQICAIRGGIFRLSRQGLGISK